MIPSRIIVVVVVMMMVSPPTTAVPAAPAETPTRTVPAVPSPAIVRIAAPTIRVIAPVPPQTIGKCRESVCIQTIGVHVPIPGIQAIDHIPIQWAADADGITGIAETDNTGSILVIILRTLELTVHPFAVQAVIFFFIDVKGIVLHHEIIVAGIVTTVIFVHIADFPLTVFYYNSSASRR